jgi:ATP-binding cassette subfamily C protein CydD
MNLDPRLLCRAVSARFRFGLVILLGFFAGLLIIAQAGSLSWILNAVFLGRQTLNQVSPLLWTLLAIVLARSVLAAVSDGVAASIAIRIKTALRDELFRHLFELGPAALQNQSSGDIVSRAVQGVEALDAYFSQYLPQLVLAALIPLSVLVFVFPLDILSGIILLVTMPLIPLFMVLIGSAAEKLTRRQYTALGRMSAVFLDTLQGLTALKALNQSQARVEKIHSASERYRITTLNVLRVTFLSSLVLELVSTISTAIVAVEIGLRLLYGQIAFQQAFFILLLAPEFYLPLRQLGLRFHAGASGVSAARAIFDLLEQSHFDPTQNQTAPHSAWPQSAVSKPLEIQFQDIRFTYPDRTQDALRDVNFTAHPGQVTAVVGTSGSGKSTLFQLLLRFIEPQSGQIKVDGLNLNSIDRGAWRSLVAWVPQRPYLFQDTIAGNLRLARPDASLADIRRAAELAGLDDFIQSLPDQYETAIAERGLRLSGGQAQRLALGRAFLKNAPILLLDEPASHLDPDLADQIGSAVRRLCQGRTVILIAHRLATVRHASQIVVMDGGRVVERGDHPTLLAARGAYAAFYAQGGWLE